MSNMKDVKAGEAPLYICLYGGSGSGKTFFSGTAPNPYFYDFDNGLICLAGKDIEYDTYFDEVKNDVLTQSGADKAHSHMDALRKDCKYDTIVIDSLTTYSQSCLIQLCKENNHPKATLHEYGLLVDHLRSFLKRLPAMFPKQHIIVTAHEERTKDEVFGDIKIRPLIVGQKLPGELPVYFNELWRLKTEGSGDGIKYNLLTKSGSQYDAKSGLHLPATLTNPSFGMVMSNVKGG